MYSVYLLLRKAYAILLQKGKTFKQSIFQRYHPYYPFEMAAFYYKREQKNLQRKCNIFEFFKL